MKDYIPQFREILERQGVPYDYNDGLLVFNRSCCRGSSPMLFTFLLRPDRIDVGVSLQIPRTMSPEQLMPSVIPLLKKENEGLPRGVIKLDILSSRILFLETFNPLADDECSDGDREAVLEYILIFLTESVSNTLHDIFIGITAPAEGVPR